MLHSPGTPDIPIEVGGLKKNKSKQRIPFYRMQQRGHSTCHFLIWSTVKYWRRGRLSAALAAASVAVSHFNLAWCRCLCRSMAAATSELHRCPRRCRDPSLRITEQIRMSGIFMGNSVICTSRFPDTLRLDCAQKDQYAKTWVSGKRRRGLSGRGKNLVLFFSTIIQGLHVSEVEYIFMNPEKAVTSQSFRCPFLVLAVCFAVFPERRCNFVLSPSYAPQTWQKKPPKQTGKINCNCQNGIHNSTALTTCPSIESIFSPCENNRDPTSHVSWFQIRWCSKQRNFNSPVKKKKLLLQV